MFGAAFVIPRLDGPGGARGDECSAYLTHITARYDQLASYTLFLHSDPDSHLHMPYLGNVLRMIALGTSHLGFLHLNGPRHVRTITPCLQAIFREIFGEELTNLVGPYCCAQFVVQAEKIRHRPSNFCMKMLSMVDRSFTKGDLCTAAQTSRSTHCYGMEFLWHLVFGEDFDPPLRQDDIRLPTALRLK